MSDQQLSAPRECEKVQTPSQPHADLQDQYVKLMFQKGSVQRDEVVGEHPGAYTGATSTISGADGTTLKANFTAASRWGDYMRLTSIEDVKTGQIDYYGDAKQASGKTWSLKTDGLSADIQKYESRNHGPGFPTFHGNAESAIQLTGTELQPRIASKWSEYKADGTLSTEAKFNTLNGSATSETGTITNNNGQAVTRFAYTFNPDGKATSCARNGKPDSDTAETLEWSLKLKL